MSGRTPPHDLAAERALIGTTLVVPDLLATLAATCLPDDYYSPAHATLWATMLEVWEAGDTVDPTLVAGRARITDATAIVADCMAAMATTQAATSLARRVADLAALRRIQAAAADTLDTITDTADPGTVVDDTVARLTRIDIPDDQRRIDNLWTADELLSLDFPQPPAVIPGMLSESDRLLLVGLEGYGKSMLLRQIAVMAASGLHPFTHAPIPAVPTLIVDLENPAHVIRQGLQAMPKPPPGAVHILGREGGIDIRNRADRTLLHRVCEQVKPRLVTIGPLYKLSRRRDRETDEDAAVAVQNHLDDLRTRFGFALVLEHHAPKGGDSVRKIVPFGSSAWMRWPEFGWQLIPWDTDAQIPSEKGLSLKIGGFRRDRIPIDKPERLDRGTVWPWTSYWPDGMPSYSSSGR